MPRPLIVSTSAGKDSTLALHELVASRAYRVETLLTTVTSGFDRVSMHGVPRVLLRAHAEALGHPLVEVEIPPGASNRIYEERMCAALIDLRERGAREVSFGDLFLADVRSYREHLLASLGMRGVFPLWKRDTTQLARRFCDLGYRAVLTCVDPKALDGSFAGRSFDEHLLRDLPEGVDPMGENGEFHTFVHDGPLFARPVELELGETVERDGFVFRDLVS